MTRLQKKCLIAVAGTHLLVIVAVLCSGFIRPRPPTDNTQVLDVIPDILVETALNNGVRGAQPPPPTPMVTPTPPAPTPTPIVQPPPTPTPPAPAPKQETIMDKVEQMFTPAPNPIPAEEPKPAKHEHEIKPDLTPVTHTVSKNTTAQKTKDDSRREERLKAERYRAALRNLSRNLTTATEVNLPGESSASSASYGAELISVYHHAWMPPESMSTDSAVVSFSVTIARDGTVISAHIVTSSGDPGIDRAVQQMLDRVTQIAPFPEDFKESQRTYPINFNATRTSLQ